MARYKNWWYKFVNALVFHGLQTAEPGRLTQATLEAVRHVLESMPEDERRYIFAILEGKTARELASDTISKTTIERMYNRFINSIGYELGL